MVPAVFGAAREKSSTLFMEASEYSVAILRVQKAKGHYSVLGVARGADANAVKRAYRALALLLHPDRNDQLGAEDAFKKLLEAYVVLSNSKHRAAYDSEQASQQADDSVKRKQKTAKKAMPPTAEELAAQKELDELLEKAYREERHAQWVQKARYEQGFALTAGFGILLFILVGIFGWLLYIAWPVSSGPQALRPGWGALIWNWMSFCGSFLARFVLAALAFVALLFAIPYAFSLFWFCTGKLCEWIFDGFGLLGSKLGPLVEAYVMSHPAGRQRNAGGGGHRRRR